MKPTEPLAWRRRIAAACPSSQVAVLQVVIGQLEDPNSKLTRALAKALASRFESPSVRCEPLPPSRRASPR